MSENGTIQPVDQRRIVRALVDKAAELRSDAARKISIAEIISDLIPRINADGAWKNVRGVKLYEGEIYLIRRNYSDLPPSDPCVARWEAVTGWREIVGYLPRPTNDALEVYCPNARSMATQACTPNFNQTAGSESPSDPCSLS